VGGEAGAYLPVSEDLLARLSARYSLATVELEDELIRSRKRDLDRLITKLSLVEHLPGAKPSPRLARLEANQMRPCPRRGSGA
tara:strand:- start:196 stop:444 length:249 start_codon:yes stop_codon:yes gene_type:complete